MKVVHCESCGMIIGPGYIETASCIVGDKTICGSCWGVLSKRGFIQLTDTTRLMPTGKVENKYRQITGRDRIENPAYKIEKEKATV